MSVVGRCIRTALPWRSIQYEEMYLHVYGGGAAAKAGNARYVKFYNAMSPYYEAQKPPAKPSSARCHSDSRGSAELLTCRDSTQKSEIIVLTAEATSLVRS